MYQRLDISGRKADGAVADEDRIRAGEGGRERGCLILSAMYYGGEGVWVG
jgi:hypothetical protein